MSDIEPEATSLRNSDAASSKSSSSSSSSSSQSSQGSKSSPRSHSASGHDAGVHGADSGGGHGTYSGGGHGAHNGGVHGAAPSYGHASAPPTASVVVPTLGKGLAPTPAPTGPPPSFTLYEPEYTEEDEGILTHDAHLNSDGEALYRFLLAQSAIPPRHTIIFVGTHTEQRTRIVNATDSDGDSYRRTETYNVTFTDFSTEIDLAPGLLPGAAQWSVRDGVAAWRGAMKREVDDVQAIGSPGGGTEGEKGVGANESADVEKGMRVRTVRRRAMEEEEDAADAWDEDCTAHGLPPWAARPGTDDSSAHDNGEGKSMLLSSRSLREWADEYCASNRVLKEFVYTKVVYGWDTTALEAALEATIRNAGYSGRTHITFRTPQNTITVRAQNRLSVALESFWVRALLWLTLVYPFLWLWRRFSSSGGGKWAVCGVAYALRRGEEGTKEGDWMRRWESTVRHAVVSGLRTMEPLVEPIVAQDGTLGAVRALDGY